MVEFFNQYAAESLVVAGLILLTIEIIVLGFATFILFFLGISLVISGASVWLGIFPPTVSNVLIANAILTTVLTVSLWQPLKRIQNKTEKQTVTNDFVGITFFIEEDVDQKGFYQHKYSGINWKVKSRQTIAANSEVEVVKADVGTLWVKPVTEANESE